MNVEEQCNHDLVEQNSKTLAEFLAANERLRDSMAVAAAEFHSLRSLISETKQQFDSQVQYVRAQIGLFASHQNDSCVLPASPGETIPRGKESH